MTGFRYGWNQESGPIVLQFHLKQSLQGGNKPGLGHGPTWAERINTLHPGGLTAAVGVGGPGGKPSGCYQKEEEERGRVCLVLQGDNAEQGGLTIIPGAQETSKQCSPLNAGVAAEEVTERT